MNIDQEEKLKGLKVCYSPCLKSVLSFTLRNQNLNFSPNLSMDSGQSIRCGLTHESRNSVVSTQGRQQKWRAAQLRLKVIYYWMASAVGRSLKSGNWGAYILFLWIYVVMTHFSQLASRGWGREGGSLLKAAKIVFREKQALGCELALENNLKN